MHEQKNVKSLDIRLISRQFLVEIDVCDTAPTISRNKIQVLILININIKKPQKPKRVYYITEKYKKWLTNDGTLNGKVLSALGGTSLSHIVFFKSNNNMGISQLFVLLPTDSLLSPKIQFDLKKPVSKIYFLHSHCCIMWTALCTVQNTQTQKKIIEHLTLLVYYSF